MDCHCFFFFFQAEDGIRDGTVTGVQTCALPIYEGGSDAQAGATKECGEQSEAEIRDGAISRRDERCRARCCASWCACRQRSEERRVGKECRSRWSTYH